MHAGIRILPTRTAPQQPVRNIGKFQFTACDLSLSIKKAAVNI